MTQQLVSGWNARRVDKDGRPLVGRTAPREETAEPSTRDVLEEARALQEAYRRDPERHEDDPSPQAFYERVTERADVREILRRLAKG